MEKILVVDDEAEVCNALKKLAPHTNLWVERLFKNLKA